MVDISCCVGLLFYVLTSIVLRNMFFGSSLYGILELPESVSFFLLAQDFFLFHFHIFFSLFTIFEESSMRICEAVFGHYLFGDRKNIFKSF